MLTKVAGCIIGGLLLSIDIAAAQDANTDQEKLQGTWDLTKSIHRQMVLPVEGFKVLVTGKTMKLIPPDGKAPVEFTFYLHPEMKPKGFDRMDIDGRFKGQLYPGIYAFEGNTVRLCIPIRPTKTRPAEFVSPMGSDLVVMTLERTKK